MSTEALWTDVPRPFGGLLLGRADLDHRLPVYRRRKLAPESFSRITIEFLLQRERLARFIVKQADVLLAVGGTLEVVLVASRDHGVYFRSVDQVKYEISVSTGGRYALTGIDSLDTVRMLRLRYTKRAAALPPGDQIDRWTFGIITNGKKTEDVSALVQSIVSQHISECEIIVCGPYECEPSLECVVRVLDDVCLDMDIRAPIAAKKNRIIEAARFNNVCILHDRFLLPSDWHRRFEEYGNYFDLLNLRTVDKTGRRFQVDWMEFRMPITQTSTRNFALDYDEWSPEAIMQGGVIVAKKHLIDTYRLDARLHWQEMEDMQFSKMATLHGSLINVDPHNFFISEAVNHQPETSAGTWRRFRQHVSWLRGWASSFVRYEMLRWRYRRRAS